MKDQDQEGIFYLLFRICNPKMIMSYLATLEMS